MFEEKEPSMRNSHLRIDVARGRVSTAVSEKKRKSKRNSRCWLDVPGERMLKAVSQGRTEGKGTHGSG